MLKPDFADYFKRKRVELGMDRGDALTQIQALLDEWYPQQVRAKRLHQGVLRLVTPSSAVAGELRMRQIELLEAARVSVGDEPLSRLQISIGTI